MIEAVELDNWHVNVRHALARDARVARDAVRARQLVYELVKTPMELEGCGACIACGVGHRCYKAACAYACRSKEGVQSSCTRVGCTCH